MNKQIDFSILDNQFPVEEFDCGEPELNDFLKNLALLYQNRRFGVTIVFFHKDDKSKSVIAYYTLCPASIQKEDLPEKSLCGPKPNPIPAFRLCRLAVDKGYQGEKIGSLIFVHALKKCFDQANQIRGNAVIIDAKNEKAKAFYEHYGFISLPHHPFILIQSMKYLQKHFDSLIDIQCTPKSHHQYHKNLWETNDQEQAEPEMIKHILQLLQLSQ